MVVIVTKHCKTEDRERMLRGHFKIGSHGEYSKAENTGLLSDNSEGKANLRISGNRTLVSGTFPGGVIENVVFGENCHGGGIVFDQAVNLPLFCTSFGDHDPKRHSFIRDGHIPKGYPPNPQTTAYLTLDAHALVQALEAATDELFLMTTKWMFKCVTYGARDVSLQLRPGIVNLTFNEMNLAFIKPPVFDLEEEVRFVMWPLLDVNAPPCIYTNTLSAKVHSAFRNAIVDEGGSI